MFGEVLAVIVILGLFAIIMIQMRFIKNLGETHERRERDLLDRVMARNYETFIQAEVANKEALRPLTAEEIYNKQDYAVPV